MRIKKTITKVIKITLEMVHRKNVNSIKRQIFQITSATWTILKRQNGTGGTAFI